MQEVTVGLLKTAMLDHPESVGYLIDGFPRELEQGELFRQQVPVYKYILQLLVVTVINWENFLIPYHTSITFQICTNR